MKVHHLAVVVADLPAAERFYSGVLGLEVVRRWSSDDGTPRSIWLGLGAEFLALERAAAVSPRRIDTAPGWHCVALAIAAAERETWRARLVKAGVPIERQSPHTLYVRDPDGNLVGLSHYPEAAGSLD
jgi:glyoxylase I family protein